MLNSRKIEDLHPVVQELCTKHILACAKRGVKIIVTSTLRDEEYQAKLYAQGRTLPGAVVTNMQSLGPHGFGLAYDVVPVAGGKAIWNDMRMWRIIGEEGKRLGLIWGGDWKSLKDYPHFQYTGGLSAADLRSGKRPQWWNESSPAVSTRIGVVTASVLNVRNRPAIKGDIVSTLRKGESVSIEDTIGNWHRIGTDMWVSSAYIKIL